MVTASRVDGYGTLDLVSDVRIRSRSPHGATIEIDGHDIAKGCQALVVDMAAGSFPVVTLTLAILDGGDLDLADAQVLIPDATRDALLALGWSEPGTTAASDPTPTSPAASQVPMTPTDALVRPSGTP